ncbi:alpha/beta hydrolase [Ruania alba]|uniref:Acetyl esterase/lipase n=1 Tax=Ruania alba TaxID=648782 RepID=A0A1H5GWL1_9MICO|nr:alpha/beta hydrolase [Ruania alba]SEE20092.1 Acetyl esterase/lipase [Ruania alba]
MRRRLGVLVLVAAVLAACSASPEPPTAEVTSRIEYGSAPEQFGDLGVPGGIPGGQSRPVVVLIHGGFWQAGSGLGFMEPLAEDLVERGYVTWNVEYRKVGEPGGGYPGTLEDVDAAIEHLAALADAHPIDLDQVVVVGHSAGGHLSLWAGTREDTEVEPVLVVGQAPVPDLVTAAESGMGGSAVTDFVGGTPDDVPAAYAAASPAERLPGTVPQLVVQGGADPVILEPYVAGYVERAREAGAGIEYVVDDEADHGTPIDPGSDLWEAVVERLPAPG